MKAYLWSNGCVENLLDELLLKKSFIKNNWKVTSNLKSADLIIINSCALNQNQEENVIKKISVCSKVKKNEAQVIVGGCFPSINKKRLQSVFSGETFTPLTMQEILPSLINQGKPKVRDLMVDELSRLSLTQRSRDLNLKQHFQFLLHFPLIAIYASLVDKQYSRDYLNKVFPLRVSEGCLGQCSYCAIKRARGHLKSIPQRLIVNEFKNGLKQGSKKFVLAGDDVGAYGQELSNNGLTIVTLLKILVGVEGNFKIAIRNFNPEWVIKYSAELDEIFKTDKISSIMVPLQSGSNKILKLMKRKYSAQIITEYLVNLKQKFPKLKIFTHMIVGFPGETDEDFKKTVNLIKLVQFNFIYIYKFECRPHTEAENLAQQIDEKIKNSRHKKACCQVLWLLFKQRFSLFHPRVNALSLL